MSRRLLFEVSRTHGDVEAFCCLEMVVSSRVQGPRIEDKTPPPQRRTTEPSPEFSHVQQVFSKPSWENNERRIAETYRTPPQPRFRGRATEQETPLWRVEGHVADRLIRMRRFVEQDGCLAHFSS